MPTIDDIERDVLKMRIEKARTNEKWALRNDIEDKEKALKECRGEIKGIRSEIARLHRATGTVAELDGVHEAKVRGSIAQRDKELREKLLSLEVQLQELESELGALNRKYKALLKEAPIPLSCRIGRHLEPSQQARCIYCSKRIWHSSPSIPGMESDPCFIATAAYGTGMDCRIDVLRRYRDLYLPGSVTRWYYVHSPPLAGWIRNRGWVRGVVRLWLAPVVELVRRLVGSRCPEPGTGRGSKKEAG